MQQCEVLREAWCASCNGHFEESAEVFTPTACGVTLNDMARPETVTKPQSVIPGYVAEVVNPVNAVGLNQLTHASKYTQNTERR